MDEAHYEMFSQLRNYHNDSDGLENSVSAITSIAFLDDGSVRKTLFLLKGVWYGSGIADTIVSKGWKVSVIPLLSQTLMEMFAQTSNSKTVAVGNLLVANLLDHSKGSEAVEDRIHLTVKANKQKEMTADISFQDTGYSPVTFTHAEQSNVSHPITLAINIEVLYL